MRTLIIKLLFVPVFLLPLLASGQSYTLQFSQAKLVGASETVPTGKVWKVEGFLPSVRLTSSVCTTITSCTHTSTESIIVVNGTNVYMATSNASGQYQGYSTAAAVMNNNFWLPEGTILAAGTGVYRISVLEFNLSTL